MNLLYIYMIFRHINCNDYDQYVKDLKVIEEADENSIVIEPVIDKTK